MSSAVNSNERYQIWWNNPFSTSSSNPSTSILINVGFPCFLICLSKVDTRTSCDWFQLNCSNLPLFLVASIQLLLMEKSMWASLIIISATPFSDSMANCSSYKPFVSFVVGMKVFAKFWLWFKGNYACAKVEK